MKMKPSNYAIAILITLVTSFFVVLISAIRIALPKDISTIEVVFYMNIITAITFLLYSAIRKQKIVYYNYKLTLLRGIMGFLGIYLFFVAYQMSLSLSAGIVIVQLTPIFAAFGVVLILKEKSIKGQKIVLPLTMLLSFVGVVIIANPFGRTPQNIIAVLVAVSASIISGLSMVFIRKLMATEKAEFLGLFNSIVSIVIGLVVLLVTGGFKALEMKSYLLLFTMGIINALVAFGIASAAYFASPTKTGPFTYSSVIFAPIMQFIFFGSLITNNVMIGAIIIVGINVFNFLYTNKNYHKEIKNNE